MDPRRSQLTLLPGPNSGKDLGYSRSSVDHATIAQLHSDEPNLTSMVRIYKAIHKAYKRRFLLKRVICCRGALGLWTSVSALPSIWHARKGSRPTLLVGTLHGVPFRIDYVLTPTQARYTRVLVNIAVSLQIMLGALVTGLGAYTSGRVVRYVRRLEMILDNFHLMQESYPPGLHLDRRLRQVALLLSPR